MVYHIIVIKIFPVKELINGIIKQIKNCAIASVISRSHSTHFPAKSEDKFIETENNAPINPLMFTASITLKTSTVSSNINHFPITGVPTPGNLVQKAKIPKRNIVLINEDMGKNNKSAQ